MLSKMVRPCMAAAGTQLVRSRMHQLVTISRCMSGCKCTDAYKSPPCAKKQPEITTDNEIKIGNHPKRPFLAANLPLSSNDIIRKAGNVATQLEENHYSSISSADLVKNGESVEVTLSDGTKNVYPNVWLRDNCQCPDCFDPKALGRCFLMDYLDASPRIQNLGATSDGDLDVTWESGHRSLYSSEWLYQRAFSEEARQKYRSKYLLPKKLWSSDHQVAQFDYESLMKDDVCLLNWLMELETTGATFIKNTPARPPAAFDLCERVAKVKYTHFGDYSNVINHPNSNNLAYTNKKLNLHNDMPQYAEIPGLIFLHMIKQSESEGGDSTISDGLHAAEQMRREHPRLFEKLVTTDVYFWDKGDAKDSLEMKQFYKINSGPTIQLNNRGEVTTIRFNNQVRDSFLDLPETEVPEFYAALRKYFELMHQHSIKFRMTGGDMTVLDNVRCQHARDGFHGNETARHLVTTFMAVDEYLCRRRRLQEQLPHQR